MSSVVAIDPGLAGGVAFVSRAGDLIDAIDTRTIGEGTQRRVNAAGLADAIRTYGPFRLAVIEQVGARPGQGVSSMFRFGQSLGTVLGVVGTLAIPVHHVTPAKWKKAMCLSSDGEQSRARAIETWPSLADLFARKKDHNRAEAALLALYGLRHGVAL